MYSYPRPAAELLSKAKHVHAKVAAVHTLCDGTSGGFARALAKATQQEPRFVRRFVPNCT